MTERVLTTRGRAGWSVSALLTLVVLIGFTLRVWNVNFDQGIGSHPDERSTACFYATTIRLPSGWQEFRDPHQSPLNPLWDATQHTRRSFTYGHFPLYLGVAAGEVMHRLAPLLERLGAPETMTAIMSKAHEECGAIAVAGRLTIAALDTVTILLLFLLGRLLFGSVAGLLAASFYAFSAQAIQLSHFFAMDPASTTFVVLAVYGGVKMLKTRSYGSAVLTGIAVGLAIASKFSSMPVLAVPFAAGILALAYEGQRAQRHNVQPDGRLQFRTAIGVALALVFAAVSFVVTSPYAVLDWHSFIQATLVEQGRMVRGIADMPFTRQYRNTLPYIYFLQQQVAWGLWWPLGLVAVAGTATMTALMLSSCYRLLHNWLCIIRSDTRRIRLPDTYQMGLLVVWSWVVPYFAITGAFLAKFNRYMSPLLPFAALFAAGMLWLLWRTDKFRSEEAGAAGEEVNVSSSDSTVANVRKGLAAGLALIAVAGGLFWSMAYVNGVYRGEHTWITASRWIYSNVPEGSTILWELWDDPLPKSIPGEPGMDMGSKGLRNIDWSPYEEDTAEKYAILKSKLREADYVAYSSKRIYDSVDELPQRYPMTTRYYDGMWDGSLGYELAVEVESPPRLLGLQFDDRAADESWSLYDHPQVTIFRKVRDLSDAEFDNVLGGAWETAVAYDTGDAPLLSRPLMWLGLLGEAGSEYDGVVGGLLRLLAGRQDTPHSSDDAAGLLFNHSLAELPVVDDYRWNSWVSDRPLEAAAVWWLVLGILGWSIWPVCFHLFHQFRDRGYLLSRTAGWLFSGWLLWYLASIGVLHNTVRNAWIVAAAVAVFGGVVAFVSRTSIIGYLRANWPLLLASEVLSVAAFVAFIMLRLANPDLWQPWFGGEKFMEFAFLNGILRSPTFPPVDPHFAGGFINYYYFGIYLAAYLIKLTGIHAEVAFNLTIAMLFALTVSSAFSIAHTAYVFAAPRSISWSAVSWRNGFAGALIAPLFIAVIGNLDGFAQVARNLSEQGRMRAEGAGDMLAVLPDAVVGLGTAMAGRAPFPAYDFWEPSRVIPNTINEFPYWSFLFADLHPHVIGIPLALLFCGLVLAILSSHSQGWRVAVARLLALGFLLGALSSVNLWELPTYLAMGVLGLAVYQFRAHGGIEPLKLLAGGAIFVFVAVLAFLPFFRSYTNVGASGIGFVREPDPIGVWLRIWGLFIFVTITWLGYATARRAGQCRGSSDGCTPTGVERADSLAFRQYDRLPRMVYLHRLLVSKPTSGYLFGLALIPAGIVFAAILVITGNSVLGLCIALLGPAWLLLWKRGSDSDPAALLVALLSFTSLAILAGTQVVYLRDFLQGGDWYRMNTLFKFFAQVWLLLGLAASIAVPRLWRGLVGSTAVRDSGGVVTEPARTMPRKVFAFSWAGALVLLVVLSLSFTILGTPARLSQRLIGWRPAFGTLNGMEYMREGTYSWPDGSNQIELKYDWEAIRWLLDNVRGNPVVVESAEVDYYRAGSSRVASLTGISGLRGMHAPEQRPGQAVSQREQLHWEFWETQDIERTEQIMEQLGISLIYIGQLERYLHPAGVVKLESMASEGKLDEVFRNDGATIYMAPGTLTEREDGTLVPADNMQRSVG